MILQIIDLLRALDYVQGSSLTADEKQAVASELRLALPAKALCASAQLTHDIADARIRAISEKPVRTNAQEAEAQKARPPQGDHPKAQQDAPVVAGHSGKPRDDRKAPGGFKKVARG